MFFEGIIRSFKPRKCLNHCQRYCSVMPGNSKPSMPVKCPNFGADDTHNKIYPLWEQNNYFFRGKKQYKGRAPTAINSDPFVMMLPPPNITGTLHLGHALTVTLQDSIVRWNAMKGRDTVWVPGCDHAGIATQVVLEKHLLSIKGLQKHELSRKQFLQEAWEWKKTKEKRIYEQLKKLGAALDWNRAVFTLDASMSEAVTKAFIILFDRGLITRKDRIVNFCCALQSVIADIEVEHRRLEGPTDINVPGFHKPVKFGQMYDVAYPLIPCQTDSSETSIIISTTSPETIPADTAVMVHPEDQRYKHLIGRRLKSIFRPDEHIPIIGDFSVDPKIGTGAVKVTPAHSEIDYQVGVRHNLPSINLYNDDGTFNNMYVGLGGLHRYEAREKILSALNDRGALVSIKPHAMALPVCSRTGDVVISVIKKQWYIRLNEMVERSLAAVESGELIIQPDSQRRVWNEWMKRSKDSEWCISRQLWWGHQLPVYQVQGYENEWVAAASQEEAIDKAAAKLTVPKSSITLLRDEDVLDTWFSSALFPFAALGWPKDTSDLKKYYPTSLLVTGQDILFFWVARMVMIGTEITGVLPFKEVQLHALICDQSGAKMSKSKGNVVDPMTLICGDNQITETTTRDGPVGADVLRMALLSQDITSDYIPFGMSIIAEFKALPDKMWQTVRFMHFHCDNHDFNSLVSLQSIQPNCLQPIHRWLLHETQCLVLSANEAMQARTLYHLVTNFISFWKGHMCDVYLEAIKPELQNIAASEAHGYHQPPSLVSLSVLNHCLSTALKCIAPIMPYLTEELYHWLPTVQDHNKLPSIMAENYPSEDEWAVHADDALGQQVHAWLQVLTTFRSLKVTYNVNTKSSVGTVYSSDARLCSPVDAEQLIPIITALAKMEDIKYRAVESSESCNAREATVNATSTVGDNTTIHLHLQGALDVTKELDRLSKKAEKLSKLVKKLQKRHKNDGQLEKTFTEIEQLERIMKILQKLKK